MQIDPKSSLERARAEAEDPAHKARLEAARKFEGILMQQLLSVMRNTAKSGGMMGSDGASGQYMSMFDEVMADRMAEGGGIGLAQALLAGLGDESAPRAQPLPSEGRGLSAQGGIGTQLSNTAAATPAVGSSLPGLRGATARLAQAAYAISAPEGGKQWSRDGTLTQRDLASQIETPTANGVARFSVRDAQGFRDNYKCNLFAFEAARRAGFEVPVVARAQGWGFPTSNVVTEDAQDGELRGDWAQVVPKERLSELKGMLERGEVGLMLTGNGTDGRHGHMAVVERIHSLEVDAEGELKRIEFDGYEARVGGAEHLTRRSWNRHGSGSDSKLARNGFGAIEALLLRPAKDAQAPEITLSGRPRSSRSDAR